MRVDRPRYIVEPHPRRERVDAVRAIHAAHLDGRLGGWKIDVNGESFPMEHGFHGFFAQYHNLYEILGRVGAVDNLAPPPSYPIVFPDRVAGKSKMTLGIIREAALLVLRWSLSRPPSPAAPPHRGVAPPYSREEPDPLRR